jgi:hypothetical protein
MRQHGSHGLPTDCAFRRGLQRAEIAANFAATEAYAAADTAGVGRIARRGLDVVRVGSAIAHDMYAGGANLSVTGLSERIHSFHAYWQARLRVIRWSSPLTSFTLKAP